MKKVVLIFAIFFLPLCIGANEVTIKDMPDPMAKRRLKVQRPDGEKLLLAISAKLKLSSKQQERILKAINKETEKFDDIFKEYKKAREQEKKWRFKMNELRHRMLKLNMNIPEVLRQFLDEEQKEVFDTMIENSMAPKKRKKKRKVLKKRRPPKSKMGKVLKKKIPPQKKQKKLLETPEEEEEILDSYYP